MRTTHVHREENRAFVLILLSFSRCDNIFLSPNGVFYIILNKSHLTLENKVIQAKNFLGMNLFFIFLHHLTFPKGLKNVIAELIHS